ncbi:hypothetical protein [Streptomyces chartreusis]|uniref:hypothetical protein n=1 Tax=Streptomyces chartreusis TaxID=1969 RepID=UPI0037DC928F|nr:hypothetical protein OG938_48445 [Streptomyces chartreusis]
MEKEQQARFQRGEQVLYVGTVARVSGWLFKVVSVRTYTDSQPHYDLHEETWGQQLLGVRESSLRCPHDGRPQTAATVLDGVAPPTSSAGR